MRGFAAAAALVAFSAAPALAYTAAGDRVFPATILLPQNAPSDDFYVTPFDAALHSTTWRRGNDRLTNF